MKTIVKSLRKKLLSIKSILNVMKLLEKMNCRILLKVVVKRF